MSRETRRAIEVALALFLFVGLARENTRRLERAAERQILQQLGGQGQVCVNIQPRWGAIGVWIARATAIKVYASGFSTDRIPFFTEPSIPGWSGRADKVSLVLENFYLGAVPVHRLEATIPQAVLDSRAAAFHLRIRLFETAWGEGSVTLLEQNLAEFVQRRLPDIVEPRVRITPSEIHLSGRLRMLLSEWQFEVRVTPAIRHGREVVVDQLQVRVEGEAMPAPLVEKLRNALNPILDIMRDLRLGSAFVAERLELGEGYIRLIGRATVPPRQ